MPKAAAKPAAKQATPPGLSTPNFKRNSDFGSPASKRFATGNVKVRIIQCRFQEGERKGELTGAHILAYKAISKADTVAQAR